MDELPTKWCIKLTRDNLDLVGNWYNKQCFAECYTNIRNIGSYYASHTIAKFIPEESIVSGTKIANCILKAPTKEFPKITLEQFKEIISQQNTMNTQEKIKQLEEELNKLKEEVKKETEFKVGDWVTTISKAEECYYKWKIGEIFQITGIDIQDGVVYFNSHNSVEIERVRKATQSEITKATSKSKELYFGDTKVTIKQGNSYAETQYGNISKVEIKEIIDFFNQDITLLGHKMSIKNSSTWYIAFGCQQGTLGQIKEIYKAFD